MMRLVRAMGIAAATLFVSAQTSQATVITAGSNNPLAFSWAFTTPGNVLLDGTGTLSVSGFSSNSLTVTVTLNNDAPTPGQGGDRLTSFGFGIDPNATGISFNDAADGGMIAAVLNNIPSLNTIEACAYGGNNCSGGSNGGILAGASDTFQIILAGTWGTSVDIAPIGFKYQTGAGSFEFTASSTGAPPSGLSFGVPEPGTSALLLLGVGALSLAIKRRRAAA